MIIVVLLVNIDETKIKINICTTKQKVIHVKLLKSKETYCRFIFIYFVKYM